MKRFFCSSFLGIQKTVDFVCVLAISCKGDVGGRVCSVDNSLSKVYCDNHLSLRIRCVDDDVCMFFAVLSFQGLGKFLFSFMTSFFNTIVQF